MTEIETKASFGKPGEAHTDGKPPMVEELDDKPAGYSIEKVKSEAEVNGELEKRFRDFEDGRTGTREEPAISKIVEAEDDHMIPISNRVGSFGESEYKSLEDKIINEGFTEKDQSLPEVVDPSEISGEIDVDFVLEAIQDKKVHDFLVNKGLSYLENVWENSRGIEIFFKPDGDRPYITINAFKNGFFSMPLSDFFEMCSLPDINLGNSCLKAPDVNKDTIRHDRHKIKELIGRIRVNGRSMGSGR